MGQLLLFAENETFEQHVQAIIADKVRADAQLAQLGVCVLLNTVYDGFETGLTDAVVADVNELNGLVDLEHLTDRSRTVNIENVAVQVNALESLVLLHGVAEAHNAGDTEFAAAQVQVDQTLIEGEGRCEELGSLLVYGALPQVQLLDVAGAHRVLANRVGNEANNLLCKTPSSTIQLSPHTRSLPGILLIPDGSEDLLVQLGLIFVQSQQLLEMLIAHAQRL